MFDLSSYDLKIGRSLAESDLWFEPVLKKGRGAVFVDTGFLRALIDDADGNHRIAEEAFSRASANYYTTAFVLAETVRQIIKKGRGAKIRNHEMERCTALTGKMTICNPPADLVSEFYRHLIEARYTVPDLDLCDAISIGVLNYAQHRRVFGFDRHFGTFGAHLEPRGAS